MKTDMEKGTMKKNIKLGAITAMVVVGLLSVGVLPSATVRASLICGDVNFDGTIDVGDVVFLIAYLYRGGPQPRPVLWTGDCNVDGVVNIGDILYMINYLYKQGPPMTNCCPW